MSYTPRDVHTTLNYTIFDGGEPLYQYVEAPPPGVPKNNIKEDPHHDIIVHDIRGKEDTAGLDITGFEFVNWPSVEKDFTDEEAIRTKYYQEVEDILKKHAGAKRVVIFDHTIRRNYQDVRENTGLRGPVKRVHVDQTFVAGIQRVQRHLGEDAERLIKGRVRIINVWRPIENPVAHSPLAVADYRSINPKTDLLSTRHIYPDREGSTFSVHYNPSHKWYYLSDQTPDEAILIKCFDSQEDVARLTPHTAFARDGDGDRPQRQSIEVRALVFDQE